MAAELLLTYAMEESLKMLGSVATDTISRALGLKRDLKKLDETTKMIQYVLQDAEEKQTSDDRVKKWLEKLQDVVYAAGDVLDEFSYETLRRQVEIQGRLKLKAREFVSRNNPIWFRLKMAKKVKDINESLAEIEKEASRVLNLQKITGADRQVIVGSQLLDRATNSFLGKSEKPIGREKDVERITAMLQAGSSNPPSLTFICIDGLGGIGKTTLAKLVLKEVEERKLFEKIMWVCVTDDFDYKRVLLEMLQKLDTRVGALSGDDVIVGHLKKQLTNEKFLLVLDDVWNDKPAKWKSLIDRLGKICEKDGNFVIVTTRKTSVAEVLVTSTPPQCLVKSVKLGELSHETCWSIIKHKCLEKWSESDSLPAELETTGIEISKKCGGLPLVAQVLGGTLCSTKDRQFWLSIQDSSAWEKIGEGNGILPVLKLSFDHLSPHVKRCFTYCSLFPKDFKFEKDALIQLWMAEDFLNAALGNGGTDIRSMEDVGEEYFSNLLADSFFQDAQVDSLGKITHCKMHDLLHDLALSVSKTKMLPVGSGYIFKTCDNRRINFECNEVSEVTEWTTHQAIRSLFCKVDVSKVLPNVESLRSLNMSKVEFKELPFAIKKLNHLRYLNISWNKIIEVIPESITKLYNLQTLRLLKCSSLKKLPDGIGNLMNLRHIYFDDGRLMTFKVARLTNLQTLPFFVVGSKEGYKVSELIGLTELRGEVEFSNLQNVGDGKEAKGAELEKKKLSKLILVWTEVQKNERKASSSYGECNHEDVLTNLQPAPGLLSLIIKCYMGKAFPQWMSIKSADSPNPLENLMNLGLKNCKKCENMPTLGHLPCLKVLMVEGMDGVQFMGSEFYGESNNVNALFPALQKFFISKMKSLVEWVTLVGTKSFPKLREVYIYNCPSLTSFRLSQSISTAIVMPILISHMGGDFVEISCLQDLKSFEFMHISKCPKLIFPHLGLTSFQQLTFHRGVPRDLQGIIKKLSLSSNGLVGSLQTVKIVGAIEIIQGFPKFLKALEICRFNNLLADAFDGLSSLEHLKIEGCDSLESIPTLSSLTSLKHLQMNTCNGLESIPTLSSLTSLNHLQIEYCGSLNSIPNLSSLISLKILRIGYCRNLSDLSLDFISTQTCLEELRLSCLKLRSLPGGIKSCQSLKELVIEHWAELSNLSPISFSVFTRLEKLCISRCPNLRSLPAEIKLCTSLKELSVKWCEGLTRIDDDMIGSLTQLQELEWGGFSEELEEVLGLSSIHLLTSLQKVEIIGWNKLTSLPHQLQHLTFITELEICNFNGVESLPDWLGNLSSLQSLSINWCLNLKNITTVMQCLSKLTSLEICICPCLKERCAKDVGPELSNISHIPHIKIDGKDIQDLRSQANAEISN